MKTVKQFLISILFVSLATTLIAQDGTISPVYIPGAKLETKNVVKTFKTASATKRSYAKAGSSTKGSNASYFTIGNSGNRLPVIPEPSASTSYSKGCDCGGIGCDSGGCDAGGIGCECGSGGFESVGSNYLDCDCSSGNCGCGGRGRLGRSFFGRVRNLIPIKFSVNRQASHGGGSDCGCDECTPGNCQTFGSRLLPVSFRLCSNHCSRYISVFGGYVDLEDYDGSSGAGAGSRLLEFNDGWQLGLKRGRVFNNGIRLESEISFRHNTNDSQSLGNFVGTDFVPASTFDSIDSVFQISTMTNVLYDLTNWTVGQTTPYVGLGLGGVYADGDIITPGLGTNDFIDDYVFAYQLIVGLNRRINNNFSGFAEYKYFGSSGVDFENVAAGGVVGDFDLQSNNIIFGLRFRRPN